MHNVFPVLCVSGNDNSTYWYAYWLRESRNERNYGDSTANPIGKQSMWRQLLIRQWLETAGSTDLRSSRTQNISHPVISHRTFRQYWIFFHEYRTRYYLITDNHMHVWWWWWMMMHDDDAATGINIIALIIPSDKMIRLLLNWDFSVSISCVRFLAQFSFEH